MAGRISTIGKVVWYLALAALAGYVLITAANAHYFVNAIGIAGVMLAVWLWSNLIETRNADRYNLLIKKLDNIQRAIDKADL